jgi:TPP-dependent pyruvate/acetoin dehydrogenase alpha subunit
MSEWLVGQAVAVAVLDGIRAEVKAEVDKAVQFAIAASYPAVDKVDQDVYA